MKYFRDRDDGKTHDDRNGIWLKVYAILMLSNEGELTKGRRCYVVRTF